MSLTRLKWVAIVVPLAFLVVLDYLRHQVFYAQLHTFPGFISLLALLTVAISVFSFTIFGVIGRLERQVLGQNQRLAALNRIAAASAGNLELKELLNVGLDEVLGVMKAEAGLICLLNTETEELVAACYRGFSDEGAKLIQRQKLDTAPMGKEVVRTGRPVVREKLLENPQVAEVARREGFHSVVSVPLKSEREVTGVLGVATRRERHFTPAELELLTNIGGQLGLAVRSGVLFTKAQQRNQELAALLAVGRAAVSSLDLTEILDKALDAILEVTSAEAAEVWLMADGDELTLERHRGIGAEAFRERTRFRLGEGLPGLAAQQGTPVVVHDLASDPRFLRQRVVELGLETFCALPLSHRGETVGVLAMAARDREALSSGAELRLLEGIGERLAIAIENNRLHQQVLDRAVLEERERIARELHDGLAQVLGYINTQTLAIKKLLASGDTDEAKEELNAMEAAAKEVYADVREAILGLRASLARGGLILDLRSYIGRYSEMAGVTTQLQVSEQAEALKLPAWSEIQLMRIIQEALSNIRKHARASRARVSFEAVAEGLRVEVADDGQGFDPERLIRTGWPRFGLQMMRERAKAIGGELEVLSIPRQGTRVVVQVPLKRMEEVSYESSARR